jgi:plastocyanin
MKSPWRFVLLTGIALVASDCGLIEGNPFEVQSAPPVRIIKVADNSFAPDSLNTVPAPTTVRWEWSEQNSNMHSVTWDTLALTLAGGQLVNSTPQAGGAFELQFGVPGVFAYHCSVHPDMKGVINVRPNLCENGCPVFP